MDFLNIIKLGVGSFFNKILFMNFFWNIYQSVFSYNFLKKFENSLKYPKKYYKFCELFLEFHSNLKLKQHRLYYKENQRAFGEDAFTSMWTLLYERYKFHNFLEIGVYRGQTLSLITLLAGLNKCKTTVVGITPLESSGDSVSSYPEINYYEDIKNNFLKFNLALPKIIKAYSTDDAAIVAIKSTIWDCIYIDGNHDYENVKADFNNVIPNLKKGGIIVFDDASLNLIPEKFHGMFRGHPGPSNFVDEISNSKFEEILRVGHNRCFRKL
jgi:predicted O-methyltransferase YrrM